LEEEKMAGELANWLKEATAEDSRHLLEEFLKAFFPDPQTGISDAEPEELTLEGHVTK